MTGRHCRRIMFRVRIEEHPLPTGRDRDQLINWLVATFGLIRRRGEEHSFGDSQQPVVVLLRDHFLANPNSGVDASILAKELGLAAPSLHHHIVRLNECRLIASKSEGDGWRRHFLRGASLSAAIKIFSAEARIVLDLQMSLLEKWWQRNESSIQLNMPTSANQTPLPLRLWIAEPSPLPPVAGVCDLSAWMADLGLLGDRPTKSMNSTSVPVELFKTLLQRGPPLSIDEAVEMTGATKPRLTRIFDRFRASGIVERVPRTDRLSITIWAALESQYRKRGEDWLMLKGGLNRQVPEREINVIIKALNKGKLTPELVEKSLSELELKQQMLLLNLLGGRLPLGYRLVGTSPLICAESCKSRLDRVLRRLRRVAEQLEESMEKV